MALSGEGGRNEEEDGVERLTSGESERKNIIPLVITNAKLKWGKASEDSWENVDIIYILEKQ